MERVQQAGFLTCILQYNPQQHHSKQNQQLNRLRSQIKSLFDKLPDQDVIKAVLQKLKISSSVITAAKNIDKSKETKPQYYRQILVQLKTIQKQSAKLKNCNSSPTARVNQKLKQQNQNTMKSIPVNANLNALCSIRPLAKTSNSNRVLKSNQSDSILRKQLQAELSYRKRTLQMKDRSFVEKKQQFLLNKVNRAKQMNKRSQRIHREALQQQSRSNETAFQQIKSHQPQDFSIWAKKPKRAPLTSSKHSRAHLRTCNDELIISEFDRSFNDFTISERPILFTKISSNSKCKITPIVNGNTNSINSVKNNQVAAKDSYLFQNSGQNSFCSQNKSIQVLQKKSLIDQQKVQFAIERIVLKNLRIQSLHHNRSLSKEQSMIKSKQKFQQKQTLNQSNLAKSIQNIPDQRQIKLQNKLYEGQSRKNTILQQKSQKIRDNMLRKREQLLQRRYEIDWNRKQNIMVEQQYQMQLKKQMKQEKYKRDNNVQFLIKKKRQQCDRRQVLSQQIANLKKASNITLQKKLQVYNKQTQLGIFQLWANS